MSRRGRPSSKSALVSSGTSHLEYETVTLSSEPLVYARRAKPVSFRKTSMVLTRAWEDARRVDFWVVKGFLPHTDAADAWAVAGDAAEDIGAVRRAREARRYEKMFRRQEKMSDPPRALLEGPLLPWPEIERWTHVTGVASAVAKLGMNSMYGRIGAARRVRHELLAFASTEVGPGERVTLGLVPQVAFRPRALIIGSEALPYFVVEGLRIGMRSQLRASADPLPASLFTPSSGDADMMTFDTASTGEEIRLDVRNVSQEPRTFRAALRGITMEEMQVERPNFGPGDVIYADSDSVVTRERLAYADSDMLSREQPLPFEADFARDPAEIQRGIIRQMTRGEAQRGGSAITQMMRNADTIAAGARAQQLRAENEVLRRQLAEGRSLIENLRELRDRRRAQPDEAPQDPDPSSDRRDEVRQTLLGLVPVIAERILGLSPGELDSGAADVEDEEEDDDG